MTRIRIRCPFVNVATGERREIVVELTRAEVTAVQHQAAFHHRSIDGGWPPLEKLYASRRAARIFPWADYEPLYTAFRRVPALQVMSA